MRIVPNRSLFFVNVPTSKVEVHNPKGYFQPYILSLPLHFVREYGSRTSIPLLLILILLHGFTAYAVTTPVRALANPLSDVSLSDEQYREVYDFLDRMVAKKAIGGVLERV